MKKTSFLSSVMPSLAFACLLTLGLTPVIGWEVAIGFGTVSFVSSFLPKQIGVLGLNNSNNQSARESYRIAKDLFFNGLRNLFPGNSPGARPEMVAQGDKECREFVNSRKLSQSEIRLEVRLNATNNTFNFALTGNQINSSGIIFNTENRLTMQDSLVCSEYLIAVGHPASDTDTAWELETYGNAITFGAGPALAINTTFFSHGYFRVTANNDVVAPYRGLFNHWYRPQTQQTAAFGAASPMDQIRGAEDGSITMEPNMLLIGSKGYIPQIVLPTNLAAIGTFDRAVLIFRGVLAQNSTSVS